ncbi:hypothetical protein CGRA01v4_03725 [Colletotrichum graminicola]|nr:hypothetical protein CGRA01v4_03725 [Colletotrichum graminicola]
MFDNRLGLASLKRPRPGRGPHAGRRQWHGCLVHRLWRRSPQRGRPRLRLRPVGHAARVRLAQCPLRSRRSRQRMDPLEALRLYPHPRNVGESAQLARTSPEMLQVSPTPAGGMRWSPSPP